MKNDVPDFIRSGLSIARALIRKPDVILLDEATAALDPTTETLVLSRLRERFAGRTMLIVTHRIAALRDADRILLLDQGVLLEDGNWSELMALQGSFATLAAQQQADAV